MFSPKDRSVRPTTDRVKESIFNLISADVEGAEVLDLFAGSGALGIESLSRGAAGAGTDICGGARGGQRDRGDGRRA